MTLEEIHGSLPMAREVPRALEALQGEGLAAVRLTERGAVYEATPRGLAALAARGVEVTFNDGPVAIMFTDLVSSSALIETLGEQRAHAVLRRHFALLRESIAGHGGHEVKSLGDGLMVVFDHPAAAWSCARAMQKAVARDRDGLGLRIGIDVGEPLREGNDYFGRPVIAAKRWCDEAAAGEILVSDRIGIDGAENDRPRSVSLRGLSRSIVASVLAV